MINLGCCQYLVSKTQICNATPSFLSLGVWCTYAKFQLATHSQSRFSTKRKDSDMIGVLNTEESKILHSLRVKTGQTVSLTNPTRCGQNWTRCPTDWNHLDKLNFVKLFLAFLSVKNVYLACSILKTGKAIVQSVTQNPQFMMGRNWIQLR